MSTYIGKIWFQISRSKFSNDKVLVIFSPAFSRTFHEACRSSSCPSRVKSSRHTDRECPRCRNIDRTCPTPGRGQRWAPHSNSDKPLHFSVSHCGRFWLSNLDTLSLPCSQSSQSRSSTCIDIVKKLSTDGCSTTSVALWCYKCGVVNSR